MRTYALLIFLFLDAIAFGVVGSLLFAFTRPTLYQAQAQVVVYEMPPDFRELIGPDEANQIESVYQAGALQDAVVSRVLSSFPDLTAKDLRARVTTSIIAYTPLTQVTATAPSAQQAVDLANKVAEAWVNVSASTNSIAYTTVYNQLTTREQTLIVEVFTSQREIQAAGASRPINQPYIASLQSQLQTELNEETNVEKTINQLDVYRMQVLGDGYVATPADLQHVTRTPDLIKTTLTGAGVGSVLAVVLLLWFIRPSIIRRQRGSVRDSQPEPEHTTAGEQL